MTVSTNCTNKIKLLRPGYGFRGFTGRENRPGPSLMIVVGLILTLFSTIGGCDRGPPRPEAILKQFLADLRAHHSQPAWDALSASNKAELTRRAEAIAQISKSPTQSKPVDLLFRQMELVALRTPESISVVSPIGSSVTLRVSVKDGRTANIKMIREGPGWKIDLLGSVEPIPTVTSTNSGPIPTATTAVEAKEAEIE